MSEAWAAARIALDIAETAARAAQTAGLLALHLAGPVRAVLLNLDESGGLLGGPKEFEFPFNPESLSLSRSAPMNTGSGRVFAGFEEGTGTNDVLSFDIWLDASDVGSTAAYAASAVSPLTANVAGTTGSVLEQMQELYALTQKKQVADSTPPVYRAPVVAFLWQELRFTGIVTSIGFDVTLFDALGAPRRAKVSIRMEGQAFEERSAADVLNVIDVTKSVESFTGDGSSPSSSTSLKATALQIALRLV